MKHEKIHLRPTALWLIFGPVLGCMWLAAVNYSNNLVYAILYLIAALSFISVFHTWRNLAALRVENIRIQPAFAGDEVRVEVFLRNPSKHTIYGLFFSRGGDEASGPWPRPTPLRAVNRKGVRLAPGDTCSTELVLEKMDRVFKWGKFSHLPAFGAGQPTRGPQKKSLLVKLTSYFDFHKTIITPGSGESRGLYPFGSIIVRTSYPFGLVWASYRLPVDAEYYIYPQPKGATVWPQLRASGESGSPMNQKSGDDFSGVRAYMPGESLRHVDWKAFARGRPLSVKQFSGGSGYELWLDAEEMDRVPLETRLSQLALWIVNAEKEEIPYALKLGRTTLPLGLGPAHSRRALEALAVAGVGST